VFDPVVQPGRQPVTMEFNLAGGLVFRLVAVGDFDGDGRDEIAATHTAVGQDVQETLKVFDGGTSGTVWTVMHEESFNALWKDFSAGDMNGDGRDDLAGVRNVDLNPPLIKVWSGGAWGSLTQRLDNFPWFTVVLGNLSNTYAGQEMVLTRDQVLGQRNSVITFRLAGNALVNLVEGDSYLYYPPFTSVAVGDLNNDGDEEIVLLRDPLQNSVSLLVRNPVGAAMRTFQQTIGFGSTAWKLVRCGDLDGDGYDEIVVSRYDRYRIYNDPHLNDSYTDVLGGLYVNSTVGNWPSFAIGNVDGGGQASGPVLGVSPKTVAFDLEYGQASGTKSVSITNIGDGTAIAWQAAVVQGVSWLRIDKTSGNTPGTLGLSVDQAAVTPGSYAGKVRISSSSAGVTGSPQDVDVTLVVRGVSLSVSPKTMTFNVQYGSTPPSQSLTISSAGGSSVFNWEASVIEGAGWLTLSRTSGATPSTVQVSLDPLALAPGQHTGTIRVRSLDAQIADSPQFVTIIVNVQDSGLVVSPSSISLVQKEGAAGAPRQIQILRPGLPTDWVATALPAAQAEAVIQRLSAGEGEVTAAGVVLDGALLTPPEWLQFTPQQGTTPNTMQVWSTATTAGQYGAVIMIVATDPNTPNRVHVVDVNSLVVKGMGYLPLLFR
jgi:hypothetical protein